MNALEDSARKGNRSLIVLDTIAGDPSNMLYQSLVYIETGQIPIYAESSAGSFDTTVI